MYNIVNILDAVELDSSKWLILCYVGFTSNLKNYII